MKTATALLVFLTSLFADVRSTTGSLEFDIDNDGQAEMHLNTIGLSVGASAGYSTLEVQGTLGFEFATLSTNTTLHQQSMIFANTSLGNITLTLPNANSATGRLYKIKKITHQNDLILSGGNHLIDGQNQVYLEASPSLPYLEVASNGSNWFVLKHDTLSDSVVSSDNLTGWWQFDQNTGTTTALDSSTSNNNGTLQNMDSASDWVSGQIGQALDFDGTDDYVEANNVAIGQAFTISLWAKSNTTNWDDTGMFMSSRGGSGFVVHPNNGTRNVAFYIQASSGGYTNIGTLAPADIKTWHHYAMTYSGNTLQTRAIYLDGIAISTGSSSVVRADTNITINIGKDHNLNRYLNGQIDDARVYNKALSNEEMRQICQKGR